jgi:hypothetical protein
MNNINEIHHALVTRVAQQYEKDGYKVYFEPGSSNLPFDLGSYRPDLLAIKAENDGYIIEIKSKSTYASVDRFREIAETVAQHNGWRFLLVTGDDVSPNGSEQQNESSLLSWEQIKVRKEKGDKLLSLGELEGAFLAFWGILEAMMRNQAERVSIPITHFPTSSLIKHLYSQGELSIEQFDKIMELLNIRNQFVHGFQTYNLPEAITGLQELVSELLDLWHSK